MKKLYPLALMALIAIADAPSMAQVQSQPPIAPVGDQRILLKQLEDAMITFVRTSATIAGAVSTCSPPEAVVVHDCTMLIIKEWNKASNPAPIDNPEFSKQVQATWESHSIGAHNMQVKEHTVTCNEIMTREAQSIIFKYCKRSESTSVSPSGNRGFDMTQPEPSVPPSPAR